MAILFFEVRPLEIFMKPEFLETRDPIVESVFNGSSLNTEAIVCMNAIERIAKLRSGRLKYQIAERRDPIVESAFKSCMINVI